MRQCNRCGKFYNVCDIDAGTYHEQYCSKACEYINDLEIEVHELKEELKEKTNFIDEVEADFNKLKEDIQAWKDEYINDDTYFRLSKKYKMPTGEIVCPHCNVGTIGLINDPICHWCDKNFWDEVEDEES